MSHDPNTVTLSSHVLDTAKGVPGRNLTLELEKQVDGGWIKLHRAATDEDGRVRNFPSDLTAGVYRVTFFTQDYFVANSVDQFFHPEVSVVFRTVNGQHYHIPLLLSPFGYTTYRGS